MVRHRREPDLAGARVGFARGDLVDAAIACDQSPEFGDRADGALGASERSLAFPEVRDGDRLVSTISNMVAELCYVDGRPFEVENQPYVRGLLDMNTRYPTGSRNHVWACSRQIGKSTTLSALLAVLCAAQDHDKALYVAPRGKQVSLFSNQRFRPMCEESPGLRPWVDPVNRTWQVLSREFTNGSQLNFASCYLDADGIRGITARVLAIDEIQDILSDAIPVIEQCQTRFTSVRARYYAGTHKTTSNTLNRRWMRSSRFEWLVTCTASGCKFENLLDESVIGDDAYRCSRCSEKIDVTGGRWTPMNPEALDRSWGFRVTQLMVPFLTHKDVKNVQDDPNVSRQKFYNECLGLPYDEGTLCLTEKNMVDACENSPMWTLAQIRTLVKRGAPVFAGIDYGTGMGDNPSWTVLAFLFKNTSGRYQVLRLHKFQGAESDLNSQPGLVNGMCTQAGVRWLGADWGFGADKNARLCGELGWNRYGQQRVLLEYMYTRQSALARWDEVGERYHVDRSKMMGTLIDYVRTGQLLFFRREDMELFIPDFTTIFMEYDDTKNKTSYDHDLPDDAFHAVNYALMAAKQYYGELVPAGIPGLT